MLSTTSLQGCQSPAKGFRQASHSFLPHLPRHSRRQPVWRATAGPMKQNRQTESPQWVEAEIIRDRDETGPLTSREEINAHKADSQEPGEMLSRLLRNFLKTAAVGALCLVLAFAFVNPAMAARSGGRVGGSAFSSGGMSSSMGRSFGGSSLGGSSSSVFGGSSLGGLSRSAPSVGTRSFGFYGPPSPFYGGGYGYGAPVATGGGGFGNIILLGVLAAILFSVFNRGDSDIGSGEKVTVAKLQVGLLASARQLKRDLDRMAKRADTSSSSGLHYVLQETVLALLRNPDYAAYGSSSISNKRGMEAGESAFNKLSMEERGKFKEETLVNVDGRTKSGSYAGSSTSNRAENELIVVTILVAIEGGVRLPKVTSGEELRSALQTLGGVGQEQVLACEVLWTPQDEGDHYSRDEIIQDYPTLNNL